VVSIRNQIFLALLLPSFMGALLGPCPSFCIGLRFHMYVSDFLWLSILFFQICVLISVMKVLLILFEDCNMRIGLIKL
jgi:hypothetical protein